MIVKLHGNSGSGKSYVGHYLAHQSTSKLIADCGKVIGYEVGLNLSRPIYVLGRYDTTCGGCDTIPGERQIQLLHRFAPLGHVFYEGLLGSEYYGKLGEASERYGKDHVFAFMDTPPSVCIARIKERRAARGTTKPLDETNTMARFKKIDNLRKKLILQGKNVVVIDYRDSVSQVIGLFRRGDAQS